MCAPVFQTREQLLAAAPNEGHPGVVVIGEDAKPAQRTQQHTLASRGLVWEASRAVLARAGITR